MERLQCRSRRLGSDIFKRIQMEKCLDNSPTLGIRCHFVDPSKELIGKISIDGIHPTVAGYDMIADMVWKRMQEEGVRR